jgi:hypothetical protein
MKIEGPRPTGNGAPAPDKKSPKTKGGSFDSVLKGASKIKTPKSGSVPPPPSVIPAQPAGMVGNALRATAVKKIESALNDLEFYVNTLANNDVPLSRLTPMSEALMERKDELVAMLPHMDDPEMKELITQTAALILNENSRYHAG